MPKYVFQNAEETTKYLNTLSERCGPVHCTMAMLRCIFAARSYQIQHLQRKHIKLGVKSSSIYLLPMKGHPGEWAELPNKLHEHFLEAARSTGIITKVERKCGNRPCEEVNVVFKIPGGENGFGTLKHRNDYVFKPSYSGSENVV